MLRVLIGCERFGVMRDAFRALGHEAYSCDLVPDISDSPYHLQTDVREVLRQSWDLAIFHPDCTYLSNAGAWALSDPDFTRYPGKGYHQQPKFGTLTGAARRQAKADALDFIRDLTQAPIPHIAIENPLGAIRSAVNWEYQQVHPWQFGEDAEKTTYFLRKNLPALVHTKIVLPTFINGLPVWGNQTATGQNKLPEMPGRAMERAKTYAGIAAACADQWGSYVKGTK